MNLRTVPTIDLVRLLSLNDLDNQITNNIAYELAYRLYVPNNKISFESLLARFGYKEIEESQKELKLEFSSCKKS